MPAHRPRLAPALAALALALLPAAAAAAALPLASFEDAEDDATGPGGYLPPTDRAYKASDFDLRRFAVLADGDTLLFVVTLGAPVREPPPGLQGGAGVWLPRGGLSLQTIDIYLDTDPTPGAGVATGLPGRRVAFAGGRTWEAAVVLTPQPEATRLLLRQAMGADADRVVVPESITLRGRTITARVPAAQVGGRPRPGWGWSVHVSGARLVTAGATALAPDALTLPVQRVAGPAAFGGAPAGDAHPQVLDVLLAPGTDQAEVLGGFDAATGRLAQVPFVTGPPLAEPAPEPAPAAAATPATPSPAPAPVEPPRAVTLSPNLMPRLALSGPPPTPRRAAADQAAGGQVRLLVTDLDGDLLTAKGTPAGIAPMQFGRVVDAQGMIVARVMVLRLVDGGLLATVIAGLDRVKRGQSLLFDPQPQ